VSAIRNSDGQKGFMQRETLRLLIADPHSTEAEKLAAQKELDSQPDMPEEIPEPSSKTKPWWTPPVSPSLVAAFDALAVVEKEYAQSVRRTNAP
jgi:hypothetical protein